MPEKPSFQVFCSFQWFVAQFGAIPQVSRSLKSTGSCANLDAGWVAQCPQPAHGEFRCWKCRRIVECKLNLEIDRANQCQTWLSWQIMTDIGLSMSQKSASLMEIGSQWSSQVIPCQSPWGDAEEGKPSFHKSVSLPFESKAGEDSIDTEAWQGWWFPEMPAMARKNLRPTFRWMGMAKVLGAKGDRRLRKCVGCEGRD